MSEQEGAGEEGQSVASIRSMEIVVALLLLMGSAIVIYDSVRLGFGWRDDGPAPGFFPFWVAVLLGAMPPLGSCGEPPQAVHVGLVRADRLFSALCIFTKSDRQRAHAADGHGAGPARPRSHDSDPAV